MLPDPAGSFPRSPEGASVEYRPINFDDKLRQVTDHWSPKVIAKMNDYRFKLVKFKASLSGTAMLTPTRRFW